MNDSKSVRKNWIANHMRDIPKSGIRDFFELVNNMSDVVSLGIGEPDFVTPWTIRESAIYSIEKGYTSYTSNLGLLSLRREICKYVSNHFKVDYGPERECIVTVGVSEAFDLIMRAIINPGDEIIYHEPCYVSYRAEIIMAHGIPVKIDTREENCFVLDPDELEKKITAKTKAIVLNFPCNPTGATLSREQMEKIAAIVVKHNLLVISDEIYSELTYNDPQPSIASLPGMRDRTVLLHGFSKAFAMTGFRIGYACGPAELIDAMMKIHQYSMLCASITGQKAAEEALRNGEKDMLRMISEYEQRRNTIVGRLNEIGLTCLEPNGAFYAFPRIKETGLTSMEFATRLLREQKVAVVPGTAFGKSGEGYIRCSYASSMENIVEAMDKIKVFVASL